MSTITLRATKGSPLTNTEVDNNFSNLNTDKLESTYAGAMNSLTGGSSIVTLSSTTGVTTGVWKATVIGAAYGGTGVANNAASTLTISGAYGTTFTVGATTSLTLPASGTVATLAGSEAFTNKSYNGMTLTSTTGTFTLAAGKTLTTNNTLTFSGTDASSVAFGTGGTVAYTNTTSLSSLATVGTITSGTWNGSVIGPAYGGTGVANNAAATVTSSGNYAYTRTLTGVTNVTFPTSGTLITSGVTTLSSLTSIGTIATGVWNGTAIGATYGGTGQTSYAVGDLLYASTTTALSKLTAGSSGQVLTAQGAGVAPAWATSTAATTGKAIAMAMVFGG